LLLQVKVPIYGKLRLSSFSEVAQQPPPPEMDVYDVKTYGEEEFGPEEDVQVSIY
jgi:hypothetical protein